MLPNHQQRSPKVRVHNVAHVGLSNISNLVDLLDVTIHLQYVKVNISAVGHILEK